MSREIWHSGYDIRIAMKMFILFEISGRAVIIRPIVQTVIGYGMVIMT